MLLRIAGLALAAIVLAFVWLLAGAVEHEAARQGHEAARGFVFMAGAGVLAAHFLLWSLALRFLLKRWRFTTSSIQDGQREEIDSCSARPGRLAYLFGSSVAVWFAMIAAMLAASGLGQRAAPWLLMAGFFWAGGLAYAALQQALTRRAPRQHMEAQW